MILLGLSAALINAVILGAISRRLLGVPVGWPRTILVAFAVIPAMRVALLMLPEEWGLLPEDGELAPGVDPVVAFAVGLVFVAWAVAVGLGVLVILEALAPTGSLPGPFTLLRDLPARWRRSRRYATIMTIATRHGLGGFIRGRVRLSGLDRARTAQAVRAALTDAGVTFVKWGQMLSTRPDLIGPDFADELSRLNADVPPEEWTVVEQTLRQEWGREVEDVVAAIDQEPLAAASVGGVYTARLRDGSDVVVKVQRRDAAAQVGADLDILARLAKWLERRTAWAVDLGLTDLVQGFADSLAAELDYRVEADHMSAIATSISGSIPDSISGPGQQDGSRIRVPQVHRELSGRRVLVMEQLAGVPLSRAAERLDALPATSREQLAHTLLDSVIRQVVVSGVFHADLHSGNVFLLDSGEVGLIDFGSVGRLDSATRAGLGRLLRAVDRGDAVAATDALLEVVERPNDLREREVERELGGLLAFLSAAGSSVSTSGLFAELFAIVMRHRFKVPAQVAAAFRALAALEGTLRTVDPQVDLVEGAREVGRAIVAERLDARGLRGELEDQLATVVPVLQRLPRRVEALTASLQRGELSVNVRVLADRRDRAFLTGLLHQVVIAVVASAAAICGILLVTTDGGPELLPSLGLFPMLGAVLFLFAFVLAARVLVLAFRHHGPISRVDDRDGP